MHLRPFAFFVCLILGALCVLFAGGSVESSGWGAVAGSLVWLTFDAIAASRFIKLLRHNTPTRFPLLGLWRRLFDYIHVQRRREQRKLDDVNDRLDEVFRALQASPNGVTLLDTQDRIEFSNDAAAEHFSWDTKSDLGQYIHFLIREPGFAEFLSSQKEGQEIELDIPNTDQRGQSKHITVQFHIYHAGDNSERKLLLSRDVGALRQAEHMRRDFVANVSHEIATPVTVIAGFIETMQTFDLDKEERERQLTLISQQTTRIKNLVQDLLALAKLEGSPTPSKSNSVPVDEILAQCNYDAQALMHSLSNSTQRIEFDNQSPNTQLLGMRHELQSAMTNLVTNAIRYTPETGDVTVTWNVAEDGSATYTVRDTGIGIEPEHVERLTERFYRVDSSRSRSTGGTGLGLAIVKHVAQRHGGKLHIKSTLGKGSTFTLTFPSSRIECATSEALNPELLEQTPREHAVHT